jgi:eukaryotic-like serine/threonine-protein kinase
MLWEGAMTILSPGRRVSEHLELVRPLGHGAMGEVWVARHLNLDTEVAVKFIHRESADDPEVRARFELEAKAAARLKSPHVVQVFDHGVTDDGMPFLVMELLEGENLDQRLQRETFLSPALAADVVDQVARALSAAHEQGIVHRDVKPGNIFLCPDGDGIFVKLLDFGVARATTFGHKKLTQAGVMIGTPSYISREMVISPGPVDHRADLWALAVVAYEMLTGDVPFTGDTLGLVCVSIVASKPVPATSMADVPSAVDLFFGRAFSEAIDARFQSATDLAAAFDEALSGCAPALAAVTTAQAPRSANAVAETLPPRADTAGRERVSVEAMISERGATPSVTVVAAPPARRRRWAWAVAALVVISVAVLLRSALVVERPVVAPPAAAPRDAANDPPATPLVESSPTPNEEPEAESPALIEHDDAAAASSANRKPAPTESKVRATPEPASTATPASGVSRDDYGF